MKIVIIGGGAAGLYFAILMKKGQPEHDITVYERNRQDDTFGFGVVFSDETLGNLFSYDPENYHQITKEFSYWDEIDFVILDEIAFRISCAHVTIRVGHGFDNIFIEFFI